MQLSNCIYHFIFCMHFSKVCDYFELCTKDTIPVFFQKSRKLRLSLVSMQKICRYGPGRKVPIVVDGNDLEVLNGSADDGMVVAQPAGHYIHSSKVRRHDCRTMQTSRLVRNAAFPSRESSCIKMKVFKNTSEFLSWMYLSYLISIGTDWLMPIDGVLKNKLNYEFRYNFLFV